MISADQVTIAITVYNRRDYIKEAVASAINQTVSVKVIVVEDCGPDSTMESFVKGSFGEKVSYIRNSKRRGLFGNWNACLELCKTEWISILHDDDFLNENYIQSMIELAKQAPGYSLYLGRTAIVNAEGSLQSVPPSLPSGIWMQRNLIDILGGPFPFPGHLFRVRSAQEVGGFRETSLFTGDWEMWAKLMALTGAAQSNQLVAYMRSHEGIDRGTTVVLSRGLHYPTAYLQQKRILALLPPHNRKEFTRVLPGYLPLPTRYLLRNANLWRPRILNYHLGLLLQSSPPHLGYAIFQWMARLGGAPFLRAMSVLWNRILRKS